MPPKTTHQLPSTECLTRDRRRRRLRHGQATMLKKLKGKMKRRNTEPTMTVVMGGATSAPALTLAVAPQENDESSENNTDF